MLSYVSAAVLLASAPTFVLAGLDKSVLFSDGLSTPLAGWYDSITPPTSTTVDIDVPQECIDRAGSSCSADQLQAVAVTYSDCATPWVLCRCSNANMDMNTMVNRFGSVVPGVRSYVGAALALQADGPSAGSSGDFITFNGDCTTSVFFHESGHSLDQGTSPSDDWNNALASSTCVPDDYANSSNAEDFAQIEVTYAYLLHMGSLPADPSCLQPQLDYMNATDRIRNANTVTQCDESVRPFTLYTPPTTAVESSTTAPSTTAAPSTTVAPVTTTAAPTTTETSSPSTCPAGKRRRSEIQRRRAAREAARRLA